MRVADEPVEKPKINVFSLLVRASNRNTPGVDGLILMSTGIRAAEFQRIGLFVAVGTEAWNILRHQAYDGRLSMELPHEIITIV